MPPAWPRLSPSAVRATPPLLAALALVLLVHAVLLTRWPARPAGTAPQGRPVVTLALQAPPPRPAAAPDLPQPTPSTAPAGAAGPLSPRAVPSSMASDRLAVEPAPAPPPPAATPALPATPSSHPPADPAVAAGPRMAAAQPGADSASTDEPDAPPRADGSGAASAGDPPPVYPTRPPPPTRLAYALRYNGVPGRAMLDWTITGSGAGARYSLALTGRGPAGGPLVEQSSEGSFDAAGVAPERFIDRRRGRGWRAAHFRRGDDAGAGRITFSGPLVQYPAWPGAQDRLSWLAQLAGILAAAPSAMPEVLMFVADARGRAEGWRLEALGEEALDTPAGRLDRAQHWRHEPQRLDGLRVEAWTDPAQDHWPARVRFTALRSGDVFELLRAPPPSP